MSISVVCGRSLQKLDLKTHNPALMMQNDPKMLFLIKHMHTLLSCGFVVNELNVNGPSKEANHCPEV